MDTDCTIWQGNIKSNGYGRLYHNGKLVHAHRWALAVSQGIEIPPAEIKCLHSCDNPPCVNPNHLRWGTQLDNIKDMVARGRAAGGTAYKVTEQDVKKAKEMREDGKTYQFIADVLGITKKHAWNITRENNG